jgi:hypothetical protein
MHPEELGKLKKSIHLIGVSNPWSSACNIVPQPLHFAPPGSGGGSRGGWCGGGLRVWWGY